MRTSFQQIGERLSSVALDTPELAWATAVDEMLGQEMDKANVMFGLLFFGLIWQQWQIQRFQDTTEQLSSQVASVQEMLGQKVSRDKFQTALEQRASHDDLQRLSNIVRDKANLSEMLAQKVDSKDLQKALTQTRTASHRDLRRVGRIVSKKARLTQTAATRELLGQKVDKQDFQNVPVQMPTHDQLQQHLQGLGNLSDFAVPAAAVEALGAAVEALGKMGEGMAVTFGGRVRQNQTGEAAVPFAVEVAKRLQDSDPWARLVAVETLGKMGGAAAHFAGEVAKRLEDSDLLVRPAALEALSKMGMAAAPFTWEIAKRLDESDPWVRRAALKALGKMGEAAAPFDGEVTKRLEDSDPWVRLAAVEALIKMGKVDEWMSEQGKAKQR